MHLDGFINAQNYRIWSSEKPQEYRETGLHPKKLGVWCAVSRRRIVGPIFLNILLLSKSIYRGIVLQFISLLEPDERDCIFQQDRATAHTAQETITFLKDFFSNHLILHPLWPPRSPDFFLWGCLKERVIATCLADLNELRWRIEAEIGNITENQLHHVFRNLVTCFQLCKDVAGGHFQHLL